MTSQSGEPSWKIEFEGNVEVAQACPAIQYVKDRGSAAFDSPASDFCNWMFSNSIDTALEAPEYPEVNETKWTLTDAFTARGEASLQLGQIADLVEGCLHSFSCKPKTVINGELTSRFLGRRQEAPRCRSVSVGFRASNHKHRMSLMGRYGELSIATPSGHSTVKIACDKAVGGYCSRNRGTSAARQFVSANCGADR